MEEKENKLCDEIHKTVSKAINRLIELRDCENCLHYHYKSNILGGIATCKLTDKNLNVYAKNKGCEEFKTK